MEKKPNITPTPWQFDDMSNIISVFHSHRSIIRFAKVDLSHLRTAFRLMPVNDDEKIELENSGYDFSFNTEQENAKAIVTAVNNTYGKNINPEKIDVILTDIEQAVKILSKCVEVDAIAAKKLLHQALNNIKYKD